MVTGTPWRDNWVIKWTVLGLDWGWDRDWDWDWGWDWTGTGAGTGATTTRRQPCIIRHLLKLVAHELVRSAAPVPPKVSTHNKNPSR